MNLEGERNKPIFVSRNGNKSNFLSPKDIEFKEKLKSLYSYLAKHLAIKETPKVTLTKNKENAENPFGLTGYYDPKQRSIRLYITDRHQTDILRSFAHEVIHHWQNENGTLESREDSNYAHDHYAQQDLHLRKKEMEAYLFGNILFRDWQDENRYGPPKNPPVMPQPINESVETLVQCKFCNYRFDYGSVPESGMGSVKCPNCRTVINQEGENAYVRGI